MSEKNENDPLSKCEHLKLEAYRSLDRWADHEARSLYPFDAGILVFVTAVMIDDFHPFDTGLLFCMFIISAWFALALRSYFRIKARYCLMKQIERCLGFRAHIAISSFINSSSLQKIQFVQLRFVIWLGFLVAFGYKIYQKC